MARRLLIESLENRRLMSADNAVPLVSNQPTHSVIHDRELVRTNSLAVRDYDRDSVTIQVGQQPSNGTVSVESTPGYANGDWSYFSWTYTPDPGYVGSDSFTVIASDGVSQSEKTVPINVTNVVPLVSNQPTHSVIHDRELVRTNSLAVRDYDRDSVTIQVGQQPSNGTVSVESTSGYANGEWSYFSWTYTPDPGYVGSDSFTVIASDGVSQSEKAVPINVTNVVPLVSNQPTHSVIHDRELVRTNSLAVRDYDRDSVTIQVGQQPSNGTVSVESTPGYANGDWSYFSWTYTPDPGYVGSDSFTVIASDGVSQSEKTVPINVTNVVPLVSDQPTHSVIHDRELVRTNSLAVRDYDRDSVTIQVGQQAGNGTVSVESTPGYANGEWSYFSWTYTPDPGYVGSDSFTVIASDGVSQSEKTVPINVTNVVPLVSNQPTHSVIHDRELVRTNSLAVRDYDRDSVTIQVGQQAGNGTVSVESTPGYANGEWSYFSWTYTPDPGYVGSDSFTVIASDGVSQSEKAVPINVTNVVPLVSNQPTHSVIHDRELVRTNSLAVRDYDRDSVTIQVGQQPSNGTVSVESTPGYANGDWSYFSWTYTPDPGYVGSDSFTVIASDGVSQSEKTVPINVTNVVPLVSNQPTHSVIHDRELVRTNSLAVRDYDRDSVTIQVGQQPSNGTVSVESTPGYANGEWSYFSWTYTPDPGYVGSDSFTVIASDGVSQSEKTVPINVTNTLPTIAGPYSFTTPFGSELERSSFWNDLDGDSVNIEIDEPPSHGQLILLPPPSGSSNPREQRWFYEPDAGYIGGDTFTLIANDGAQDSIDYDFTITVLPPVLRDDSYSLAAEHSIDLSPIANDDEGITQIVLVQEPLFGSVEVNGTDVTYTPDEGYTGPDAFTYVAAGMPHTDAATVAVQVIDGTAVQTLGRSVYPHETEFGTFTAYPGLDPTQVESHADFLGVLDAQTRAVQDAELALAAGAETARVQLVDAHDDANAELEGNLIIASGRRDADVAGRTASFLTRVQTAAAGARSSIESNDDGVEALAANTTVDAIEDVNASSQKLEQLLGQFEQNAEQLVNSQATADVAYNQDVLGAGRLWEQETLKAAKAYSETAFDAQTEHGERIDQAGAEFQEAIADAYDGFTLRVEGILGEVANSVQQARDQYLQAIRQKKAEVEDQFDGLTDRARIKLLEIMRDYYQSAAKFKENAQSESSRRESVKTAVLALIDAKETNAKTVHEALRNFVEAEQAAMVSMATEIAEQQHGGLQRVADEIKQFHDEKNRLQEQTLGKVVDSQASLDADTLAARTEYANRYTEIDNAHRLSLFNAGVDHQTKVLDGLQAYATGSINDLTAFDPEGTSTASGTSDTSTQNDENLSDLVTAHLQRLQDNLAIDRGYLATATAEEQQAVLDNHATQSEFASTLIEQFASSNKKINGEIAKHQSTVNGLQRQFVTDANREDVNVTTTYARLLKEANLAAQPPEAGPHTLEGQYRDQLADIPADQWPLSLGVPDQLGISDHFVVNLRTFTGAIDIRSVEDAFSLNPAAPQVATETVINQPEVTGGEYSAFVQAHANVAPVQERYRAGDQITDPDGARVGTVVVRADGGRWVARASVRAGVTVGPDTDPDTNPYSGGFGFFKFFVPVEVVEAQLASMQPGQAPAGDAQFWDDVFLQNGESPELDQANARIAANDPAFQLDLYDTLSDVTPDWLGDVMIGRAGGTGDTIINGVDSFFAGLSSTVSAGITDSVREAIYGDIATQNHEGVAYTAGQIAGIAPAIGVGIMSGATAGHAGALVQFSRTATVVQTAQGFYESGTKIANGESLGIGDVLNLAPIATAGVSRAMRWVECFEGDTPVAVDWMTGEPTLLAGSPPMGVENASEEAESAGLMGNPSRWYAMATAAAVAWVSAEAAEAYLARRRQKERDRISDDYFAQLAWA